MKFARSLVNGHTAIELLVAGVAVMNMAKLLFVALALTLVAGEYHLLKQGYVKSQTNKGGVRFTKQTPEGSDSLVHLPSLSEMKLNWLEKMTDRLESPRLQAASLSCDWGQGPDYFRLFPQFEDALFKGAAPVTFSGHCFRSITAEINQFTDTSITVSLMAEDPLDLFCYDTLLVATMGTHHIETLFKRGQHTITFKKMSDSTVADVDAQGVRVFWFCDGVADLVGDFLMTLELFLGGFTTHPNWPIIGSHTTWYMEEANRKFLNRSIGYYMEERPVHRIYLNKTDIHTGDFLAITRLDGLDEIIMYGSGSHVGHSTVAFWSDIDGEMDLYILESQAGWYWPRDGIQMNKFDQWIQWADDASFNIVILPLKDEVRAAFNSTSAFDWFKTVEGLPYGYHNFAFGWLDTANDNMPPLLSGELLTVVLPIVESIIPAQFASLFGEGLNLRMGTKGLTFNQLAELAYSQGLSMMDVMAMVEVEGWEYSDGLSYVCSSFVLSFYKNAGILGDYTIYGPEFTPRDVYDLSIFNNQATVPLACQVADPQSVNLPYCQILGNYRINLGAEYGTIDPYEHMDERCPSIAPQFVRPDGC